MDRAEPEELARQRPWQGLVCPRALSQKLPAASTRGRLDTCLQCRHLNGEMPPPCATEHDVQFLHLPVPYATRRTPHLCRPASCVFLLTSLVVAKITIRPFDPARCSYPPFTFGPLRRPPAETDFDVLRVSRVSHALFEARLAEDYGARYERETSQAQAFGTRDATGVEAVKGAIPRERVRQRPSRSLITRKGIPALASLEYRRLLKGAHALSCEWHRSTCFAATRYDLELTPPWTPQAQCDFHHRRTQHAIVQRYFRGHSAKHSRLGKVSRRASDRAPCSLRLAMGWAA